MQRWHALAVFAIALTAQCGWSDELALASSRLLSFPGKTTWEVKGEFAKGPPEINGTLYLLGTDKLILILDCDQPPRETALGQVKLLFSNTRNKSTKTLVSEEMTDWLEKTNVVVFNLNGEEEWCKDLVWMVNYREKGIRSETLLDSVFRYSRHDKETGVSGPQLKIEVDCFQPKGK